MPGPTVQSLEPTKARKRRSPALWAAVAATVLVLVVTVLYSQRGPIGTKLALDYLEARGVPASLRIERLDPGGFAGSMVLGPPNDPDLTIEHMEVEFELFPVVRQGLFSPRVKIIRMTRPRLKATWRAGKLGFGTLQRVIDEFLAQPAVGPAPSVVIEGGAARVLTAAGTVSVGGDAVIDEGRITRVDARMGAHRLASAGFAAEITAATLQLRGQGARLTARLDAAAPRLSQGATTAQGLVTSLVADLPYGTAPATMFDGRFGVRGTIDAARFSGGETQAAGAKLALAFSGSTKGPTERLALSGGGTLGLEAASLAGPAAVRAPRLVASARGFTLTRAGAQTRFAALVEVSGGASAVSTGGTALTQAALRGEAGRLQGVIDGDRLTLSAVPSLTLTAAEVRSGEMRGRGLTLAASSSGASVENGPDGWRANGPVQTRAGLTRLVAGAVTLNAVSLDGRGQGVAGTAGVSGSWRGAARSQAGISAADAARLAASFAAVVPDEAALARALRTARLDAPDLRLDASSKGATFALGAPARLVGDGAVVTLSPRQGTVIATLGPSGVSGALRLAASGAAIPNLNLDLPNYRLGPAGLTAQARFELDHMDAGLLRGIRVVAAGDIAPARGGLAVAARECATVTAERVVGEDVTPATDLAASMCPDGRRPLFVSNAGGWSAHALVRDAHLMMPPAEIAVVDSAGVIDVTGGPAGVKTGHVRIDATTIVDRAKETRFRSVLASGDANLRGDNWAGTLALAAAEQKQPLGSVTFSHTMSSARGFAEIDARNLTFSEAGLQPMDISPIAIGMMTQAKGPASFFGRIDWDTVSVKSSGRVATTGLDFVSSFGRVTGMKGEVVFTSLAPLTTEVDQDLTVDHVDWLVPLDKAALRLSLTPTEIKVTRAEVNIGGGKAVLDPLDLKLGALLPASGTLRLTGIDINKLLSGFSIADKVSIEAVVDGLLPFAFTPEGLRFNDGKLFAVGPGRLSIKREALVGVSATDGAAAPQSNAMQSFAYQAMENLAFTQLDAGINSRPGGRLGVIFHINGRNDPPTPARARISIIDLIRGRAFEKDIPLPSGTPVELTLDTSLNFDELVAAYSNAGRSTPVQP